MTFKISRWKIKKCCGAGANLPTELLRIMTKKFGQVVRAEGNEKTGGNKKSPAPQLKIPGIRTTHHWNDTIHLSYTWPLLRNRFFFIWSGFCEFPGSDSYLFKLFYVLNLRFYRVDNVYVIILKIQKDPDSNNLKNRIRSKRSRTATLNKRITTLTCVWLPCHDNTGW